MAVESQSTTIYERLKLAILELDITPGLRLTERKLEIDFAASRTPVRAALLRLETEGLVQRVGRGWMAAPIDLDEIAALGEYREAIEAAVVRLACDRVSDDDLAATEEFVGSQLLEEDAAHWYPRSVDFHVEVARLAGNQFLTSATSDIMTRLARTRWLEVRTPETRALAHREHLRILHAIVARDPERAVTSAVEHVRNTNARLQASLGADRKRLSARGLSIVGSADVSDAPSSPDLHRLTQRNGADARRR